MSTETLFLTASRKQLRFVTSKGFLATEDLWQLSLTDLDRIAVQVDEEIQKAGRKSFINKASTSNTENEIRLEILKFIIETKQQRPKKRLLKLNSAHTFKTFSKRKSLKRF